jgi:hypothetical protein
LLQLIGIIRTGSHREFPPRTNKVSFTPGRHFTLKSGRQSCFRDHNAHGNREFPTLRLRCEDIALAMTDRTPRSIEVDHCIAAIPLSTAETVHPGNLPAAPLVVPAARSPTVPSWTPARPASLASAPSSTKATAVRNSYGFGNNGWTGILADA